MKTNEWLAYLLDEQQAAFVQELEAEIAGRGFAVPAGAAAAVATALRADFAGDTFAASPGALGALAAALCGQDAARGAAACAPLWARIETLIGSYVAGEAELTGGARRLAYLRLSEFGTRARAALRC